MRLPDHYGSIGVFDSGVGGLSVANAVSGLLPRESLLYVADTAYAPYGPRAATEIFDRSRRITEWLLGRGAKFIVVACNTATSLAIDRLREGYPSVPFVGLEPAVKPAASGGRVGVMATRATLESPRYLALKQRYLGGRAVWENSCEGLVPLIEALPPGDPKIAAYLAELFAGSGRLDTLVLGCTHYPLIDRDIQLAVGPEVTIINPAPAAARQVARLLDRHGLRNESAPTNYDFYATGSGVSLQRTLLNLPRINDGRRWLVPKQTI